MRVAIVNLTSSGLSGGYLKYLRRIIPYFEHSRQISDLHIFVPPVFSDLCLFRSSKLHTWPTLDLVLGFRKLKQQLRQMDIDVVFFPTARRIDCGAVPTVVMVHNMEPLVSHIRGNYLNETVRNIARALSARMACRRASRVIAVSHYVGNFLLKQWHISPERIDVIYHGIKPSPPAQIALYPQEDFIFTAGSIRPARGLEDLLCAVKRLMLDGIDIGKLVIAGSAQPKMISYQRKLKSWIETNKLSSKVCWAGTLNEEEMAWCYMNCRAFIMTSRVEACPIIALEAMSHRCICISADNPPLPEIFDSSSIYYTAGDGENLAETMKTVFAWNDDQHKSISEKAGRRAAEFSWDVCAKRTIATLIKAVNK